MVNKALFKSMDHDTRTPLEFFKVLDEEFNFTLDVSPHHSLIDMLKQKWTGRVYCNPPYNNQDVFLQKAVDEIRDGVCECAVFLIPSRTDTKRFHDIILPYAKEIRFIKGRLTFEGKKDPAPFPSMVVVFESGCLDNIISEGLEKLGRDLGNNVLKIYDGR